jgi:hypothetical protein
VTSHAVFLFMASLRLPQWVCHKKKPVKIRFLTNRTERVWRFDYRRVANLIRRKEEVGRYFPMALSAALHRCSGVAHSCGRFFERVILESSLANRSDRPSCFMR